MQTNSISGRREAGRGTEKNIQTDARRGKKCVGEWATKPNTGEGK